MNTFTDSMKKAYYQFFLCFSDIIPLVVFLPSYSSRYINGIKLQQISYQREKKIELRDFYSYP